MRLALVFVSALAGCEQPRAPPTVSKASSPKLIEAEPVGRRGFAKRDDFVCGGLGPSLLVIGASILVLDGTPIGDERELRSVLRHKKELDRQLGAPTPTQLWVELLQPGRGLVAERELLTAVREEGFTDIHLIERDVEASP